MAARLLYKMCEMAIVVLLVLWAFHTYMAPAFDHMFAQLNQALQGTGLSTLGPP